MPSAEEIRLHQYGPHLARARAAPAFQSSDDLRQLVREAQHLAAQEAAGGAENPYALQADTLAFLKALADLLTPRLIVEFGSGASTALFAGWASGHGARLISVEHDRRWFEETRRQLSPAQQAVTDLRHAALRLSRGGLRAFLSYGGLADLGDAIGRADLVLIDGPHISGREPVIHMVLSHCRPGAVVVIDDFAHYAVREMLLGNPGLLGGFAGEALEQNSHGVCVLRCLSQPAASAIPSLDLPSVFRSYWRCWRDFRQYGTGK
jgi:predicted O-methyltransferase YrrM